MRSKAEYEEALLKVHRLHEGLYRRVAEKLGVDPSYVSRVAAGKRQDQSIRRAILDEIRKIQRLLG
jgi:transcriptional regulator with XRE-family HTH domain